MAYGISAAVEVSWPHTADRSFQTTFDVVVFQPSTYWLLGPLWDEAPFLSVEERADRLQSMKKYLALQIRDLRRKTKGRLLLVQGFSVPAFSPFGTLEFRNDLNYHRMVCELNDHLTSEIRGDPDAILIDEERIFSAAGKLRLTDSSVTVFSHHGPLDLMVDSTNRPLLERLLGPIQSSHAADLLARAYLDSYLIWSGLGRIKCVVVDLDNTLWPGTVGRGGSGCSDRF